jgi:hypothetical protein
MKVLLLVVPYPDEDLLHAARDPHRVVAKGEEPLYDEGSHSRRSGDEEDLHSVRGAMPRIQSQPAGNDAVPAVHTHREWVTKEDR